MAHNITDTDNLFVVREPAWHGLGTVVPDFITDWDEARTLAGLDWDVVEAPIFARYGTAAKPDFRTLDGQKGLFRSDNGDLLSVQADTYEPFLNKDLGPLMEALVGEEDVQYETAGSLKGGRKVWILVRLREPFEVPGDPRGATMARLAIQNSHDGSGSLRAQAINTRIVCDNTSMAADTESARAATDFAFRHTKNIYDYVEDAKRAVRGMRTAREDYVEWANNLLGVRVSPAEEEAFISMFFPEPAGEVVSDRVRANIHEARDDFRRILGDGDGTTPEEIRGTAYGIVQGAVEYLDHVRGARTQETRFTRTYLTREPLKKKAEKMILEIVGA